ncbi:hypothetical protein [Sphingomonas oryzagri]
MLKRFGTGWPLFFEAERSEALGYLDAAFPDVASWLVDEERRGRLKADGVDAARRSPVDRPHATEGHDWRVTFAAHADQAILSASS